MSQELDRHRPLWEAWMVEGLEHGRWALILKIHHCMADGISGTDLFTAILDHEAETPHLGRGHLAAGTATVGPPPRRRRDVAPPPDPVRRAAHGGPGIRRAGLGARSAARPRRRSAVVRAAHPAHRAQLPRRQHRTPPAVDLGQRQPRRHEDDPASVRRNRERRHRHCRHRRPARAPPEPRGTSRRARGPYADPGLGPPGGRARHVRQPCVGDLRRSPRRHRRRGRTPRRRAPANGRRSRLRTRARPAKG